jgi:ATP-binding cassette subfamily F protein uup
MQPATTVRPASQEREASAAAAAATRKLTFKERRELAEVEARIEAAERRQVEIETELSANASDAHAVHRLYQEREQLSEQLAGDLDRWAELAELA